MSWEEKERWGWVGLEPQSCVEMETEEKWVKRGLGLGKKRSLCLVRRILGLGMGELA